MKQHRVYACSKFRRPVFWFVVCGCCLLPLLLLQVLALAGPGVMIATILMATFSHYIFPYGWDWNTCLFFGAMTSATDPVAVVALMKVRLVVDSPAAAFAVFVVVVVLSRCFAGCCGRDSPVVSSLTVLSRCPSRSWGFPSGWPS